MIALACVMAVLLAAGCRRSDRHPGGDLQGDGGAVPLRIVTLTPSASELVAQVGAGSWLVGVDEYSTHPPEIVDLPRVGSFLSPNLEAIIRLRPDLVISDDVHADVVATLGDVGIDTLTCPMHAITDLRAGLERVGARLGRADQAAAAIAALDQAVDAAGARRRGRAAPRVLAVIDREAGGLRNLVAAGPGSWIDELLAILGARNVLSASGIRYPKISPEEILRAAPDVIIDLSYAADPARIARDWADVDSVPAVAGGRVVALRAPYFLAPSPRIAEALADLEGALYGPRQ